MDKREILSFLINLLVLILTFIIIDIACRIENYKKKKEEKRRTEYLEQEFTQLLSTKNIKHLTNFKLPQTNIIIDLLIIHTSGIYVITRINLSGYIFATEHINYWDVKYAGTTNRIYNPCKNIDTIADTIEKRIKIKTIPVVVINDNSNGYILEKGNAMGIKIIRLEDQSKILDPTDNMIIDPQNFELVKNKIMYQIAT